MSAARWLVPSLLGVGAIALAVRDEPRGSASVGWRDARIPMGAGLNARGILEGGVMTYTVYQGLTLRPSTMRETLRVPWRETETRASSDSTLRYLIQRSIERGAPRPARVGSPNATETHRGALRDLRTALHAARAPAGSMDRETPKRRTVKSQEAALTAVADAFLKIDIRETSDTNLVAVLLAGTTKNDPLDAARDLLHDVGGNLARVARAEGFIDRPGFGPMARARVLASAELARRAQLKGAVEGAGRPIQSSGEAIALARAYAGGPQERVVGLYFDNANRLLASRTLHVGAVNLSLINPREVLLPAVETRAKSLILVHNHPSGGSDPSTADDEVTKRISASAKILGYRMLDHLVLGRGDESFSYAMRRSYLLSS